MRANEPDAPVNTRERPEAGTGVWHSCWWRTISLLTRNTALFLVRAIESRDFTNANLRPIGNWPSRLKRH